MAVRRSCAFAGTWATLHVVFIMAACMTGCATYRQYGLHEAKPLVKIPATDTSRLNVFVIEYRQPSDMNTWHTPSGIADSLMRHLRSAGFSAAGEAFATDRFRARKPNDLWVDCYTSYRPKNLWVSIPLGIVSGFTLTLVPCTEEYIVEAKVMVSRAQKAPLLKKTYRDSYRLVLWLPVLPIGLQEKHGLFTVPKETLDNMARTIAQDIQTHAVQLMDLLAEEDWETVKSKNTVDCYKEFLNRGPQFTAKYGAEAQRRIAGLEQMEAAREWDVAKNSKSIAVLQDYVDRHPASEHIAEARAQLLPLTQENEQQTAERERPLADILQRAVDTAIELPELESRPDVFMKNVTVARLPGQTTIFANVPSEGNGVTQVTKHLFKIIEIKNSAALCASDVVGWRGKSATSIACLIRRDGTLTIAIPREILPCELELRGVLKTRLKVQK